MVFSKATAKPIKALLSSLLAVLLITTSLPFTAMAEVDDFFEQGSLIFLVTSEGSGSEDCTVMAAFNENLDPEAITEIKVPGTVKHDGKIYSVTALTDSAFGSCTSLKSLDMSECTGLVSIGMSAFVDCEKLSSITIPCNFNKALFQDTGIVTSEDSFRIEYVSLGNGDEGGGSDVTETSGGTFTYVHNWVEDSSNAAQHKCSRCNKAEAHYGGTAKCDGKAKCVACGSEYQTAAQGGHQWEVIPSTIGAVSAEYKCEACKQTEEQSISTDSSAEYNGKNLNIILQDPYKVLPDGTTIKSTSVESGSERYNELLAQLDSKDTIHNLALFELELFNSTGGKISGETSGYVRVLMQIPSGWSKDDLEAVLITEGSDIIFEESIITIDGTDYLGFWTNHFSPYALIESATEKGTSSEGRDTSKTSPATGNSDFVLISALAAVSASAVTFIYLIIERKRKKA